MEKKTKIESNPWTDTTSHILNVAAGLGVGLVLQVLPAKFTRPFFTVFTGLMGGFYFGSSFTPSYSLRHQIMEGLAGFATASGGVLAMYNNDYRWVAFGFVVHGIWDCFHHTVIHSTVPRWFPPGCAVFDITSAIMLYK